MDKKLATYLSKLDKVASGDKRFKSFLACINVRRKENNTEIEATDRHMAVRLTVHADIGVESGIYAIDIWKNLICKGYEGTVSPDFDNFPPLDQIIPDKSETTPDASVLHIDLSILSRMSHFVDGPVRFQIGGPMDPIRIDGRNENLDVDVLMVFMPIQVKKEQTNELP